MYEFKPYLTNDGTIGLYNEDFDDIYHSATGALTESYEKFILPINFNLLLKKEKINILDICYGIGYNSKSFLNFIFEKINNKSTHIDTIHSNKIISKSLCYNDKIYSNNNSNKLGNNYIDNNIETIYTNNIYNKISITAVDNDKILSFLSPFIKTNIKNFSNENLNFKYESIKKYLAKNFSKTNIKINKIINFLIFDKIAQNYPEIYQESDLISILFDKKYNGIFDTEIRGIFSLDTNDISINAHNVYKQSFLHNIYYKHISNKYKNKLKAYNLLRINFQLKIDDARNVIKNDNNLYNVIFLDAFTPTKCPCLWSLEFFKQLYNHLEQDGIILTYSTSASVRNAMVNAGLFIGNIYNGKENKNIGTIAAKNESLINSPLSEYDLGLLKTRAGIFYRDENLIGLNEAIVKRRNFEVENSNLISSSQYNKTHKV